MLATDYRHHHGAFPAVFDCPEAVPLDVADGSDRRSSLSERVGSAPNAIVTSVSLRWCALFQTIVLCGHHHLLRETAWALLTVAILDIVVP
jgi:hypothetical protein